MKQLLQDLYKQQFWDYIVAGNAWKERIRVELATPDTPTESAAKVIAEQEIKIKRMEEYIRKMHEANREAQNHLDAACDNLGSMRGHAWY